EAELEVGLDRVQPAVLKRVGPDLVAEPDPAPLLMQIDDHAGAGRQDPADRFTQLLAAIASARREDVAGETFRMEPHQRGTPAADLALDQRQMLPHIDTVSENDH